MNLGRSVIQTVQFGEHLLPVSQLFILRRHVYASVNIKPVAPGHVLVCTRRQVKRLAELTELESVEFWCAIQEVQKKLSEIYKVDCQMVVQDGVDSGQTVEHVHCHIVPRTSNIHAVDDEARQARSPEDMQAEAQKLRAYFEQSLL